jgi:hypothetical protein
VVAAIGVIWERAHWWRTRPRVDVRVKVLNRRPSQLTRFDRGEWAASLKNWGTEVALGVGLIGYNCTLPFDRDKAVRLEPKDEVPFGVDVEPNKVGTAWISVHWSTPDSRSSDPAAWFPVSDHGALAEVYRRQMGWSAIRRFVAGKALMEIPTPVSAPVGRTPPSPLHLPLEDVVKPPPRPRWWRRGLWRRFWAWLFRVSPAPQAFSAMDVIEETLIDALENPPAQPGDGSLKPESEADRISRIFDDIGKFDPTKIFGQIPDPLKGKLPPERPGE